MTKAEVRLKILEIINRRDQNIATVIEDARTVEKYVLEPEADKEPLKEREPSKAVRTAGKTAT